MADLPVYKSEIIHIGNQWPGLTPALKTLIVFGASYCDIGYYFRLSPRPTLENPLGEPISEGATYTEPGKPNWVGHFVTSLKDKNVPLLVYDFARGGDTVFGVEKQMRTEYIPHMVQSKQSESREGELLPTGKALDQLLDEDETGPTERLWEPHDTLFSIWIGINDCAFLRAENVSDRMDLFFNLLDELYTTGMRNLMLVDVPPMHKTPVGAMGPAVKFSFVEWNDVLRRRARMFSVKHPDCTVIIYSSWDTFTQVLDDPVQYGMVDGEQRKIGGSIWVDQIHPTSKMHKVIADDMEGLLRIAPPSRNR